MAPNQPPNQPSPPDGAEDRGHAAPQANGASAAPPPYGSPPGEHSPRTDPGAETAAPGYEQPPGYGYPQGGYPQGGYPAPYGWTERKSRLAVGLLGIFLGGLGLHRFYLGHTTLGVVQLLVTIVTLGFGAIWGFVEGIMILAGAQTFRTDARGVPLRE